MKSISLVSVVILLTSFCAVASAQSKPTGFEGAKWIWFSSGGDVALNSLPAGVNYFRSQLAIPADATVESAELIGTADNLFAIYLNGKAVGESPVDNNGWKQARRWDVAGLLVPGRNVVAIQAVNTLPGPAGLIIKLTVRLADGRQIELASDSNWMCSGIRHPSWHQLAFDDTHWNDAHVVGNFGDGPWKGVVVPRVSKPAGTRVGRVRRAAELALQEAARGQDVMPVVTQPASDDYDWPEGLIYLAGDCSMYRQLALDKTANDSLNVTVFNARKSKAFPEHDLPSPMQVSRRLELLKPARPGVTPRVLLDAGTGAIGSPSVSFDGQTIFVSMALNDDPFFHIYRLAADGSDLEQLTDGPFHDIDPAELPDGRIVFTSTRIGTFEEYHSPPSRSLFVMGADGDNIRPLTHTLIFDNEPEVLADGRILFIRSDNFFDRGKVETRLHAIHTDGTEGYTEFGLHLGPEYGRRLRAYYTGSPAPMADGRLAFVSQPGITIGRLGSLDGDLEHFRIDAGDVAAMPCGRLICTTPSSVPVEVTTPQGKTQTVQDIRYDKIGLFDPDSQPPTLTPLYESTDVPIHSPLYLGARVRPPQMAELVDLESADDTTATGILFCQDARFTKNVTAGWSNVRAIRVLAGKGLTVRSSHSYIVHAGNETTELGTVPLAADGSFSIEVPANTPLALQAVDAEGRSELNEMSWIYVKPGERRGCVGCHQSRQAAPTLDGPLPMAMQTRPLKLLGRGKPLRFRGNNAAVTGMMNLQFDRYREIASLNRHAATTDSSATGAKEVALLIEALQEEEWGVRESAAARLALERDPAAAAGLAECLTDRIPEVRVAAALALATCGTRESVGPLLDSLTDSYPLTAQAAAIALENLTGHAEPFNAFAETDERKQQAEAWARWFEENPWDQIEQTLIDRLADTDRDVVRRAAVALGHTGGEASGVALRAFVEADRLVNPLPAWRVAGHQGDAARFNSREEVNPRTLQAAIRSLGLVRDVDAIGLLAETIAMHHAPETGNLFAAEAAVEALGRMGTADADRALVDAYLTLGDYPEYTRWYGDHAALMACHASPIHYLIPEALDKRGFTEAGPIVPHMIRSVPIDPDRALFTYNDDCETLIGRVIRRSGRGAAVVETCMALLGDPDAKSDPEIEMAIATIHRCWAGEPCAENRAAQILSLVCRDRQYEPRIREAFLRYRATDHEIARVFETGIPVVDALPLKNWVCFYLARSLGNLADPRSADMLIATLREEPTEAASGRPDPLGPGVLFLHDEVTPCWRAAVAWALGEVGDPRAVPVLLTIVGDLDNATDTRYAAVEALGQIADPSSLEPMQELAREYPEISTRRALIDACEQMAL